MNRQLGQAGDSPYCSFHPRELVVGVCASCLKDRLLLLLAAKDGDAVVFRGPALRRRTSSISLPKVFALGSSFLQRIDSRHHQRHHSTYSDDGDDTTSIASLDDSFISIKFEDNGKATWDKAAVDLQSATNKAAAAAPAPVRSSSSSKVVVVADHVKRGGVTRWRKQVVGRLLQLARWKRSAGGMTTDGKTNKAEKARGRGWIRSLTRRRAHGDRAWS